MNSMPFPPAENISIDARVVSTALRHTMLSPAFWQKHSEGCLKFHPAMRESEKSDVLCLQQYMTEVVSVLQLCSNAYYI